MQEKTLRFKFSHIQIYKMYVHMYRLLSLLWKHNSWLQNDTITSLCSFNAKFQMCVKRKLIEDQFDTDLHSE